MSAPANPAGCEECRQWSAHQGNAGAIDRDVSGTFYVADPEGAMDVGYKYAHLLTCNSCATPWLIGYYEDFANSGYEEFGDRHYIMRPLTPRMWCESTRADPSTSTPLERRRPDRDPT